MNFILLQAPQETAENRICRLLCCFIYSLIFIASLGTQGVAPGPVIGLQAPSTGLLGARPGLIPLQRPPGMPPPHLQRFPLMPPRPMPPHMMHRGPPPGPGGFGMPPPHGMKGPFPPHGPFVRPGGMPGLGGPGPGPGSDFGTHSSASFRLTSPVCTAGLSPQPQGS